jgi:hypothetical protein
MRSYGLSKRGPSNNDPEEPLAETCLKPVADLRQKPRFEKFTGRHNGEATSRRIASMNGTSATIRRHFRRQHGMKVAALISRSASSRFVTNASCSTCSAGGIGATYLVVTTIPSVRRSGSETRREHKAGPYRDDVPEVRAGFPIPRQEIAPSDGASMMTTATRSFTNGPTSSTSPHDMIRIAKSLG